MTKEKKTKTYNKMKKGEKELKKVRDREGMNEEKVE